MVERIKVPLLCPRQALWLQSESSAPDGPGFWYARVPAEHAYEDVMNPAYFGREIASEPGVKGLRAGDFIMIEPVTAIWWAHVRIMALKPAVSQAILRELDLKDFTMKAPPGFEFRWAGAQGHWQVWKGEHLLDGGFATQDECLEYAKEKRREKAA
jgi:hypothetical protein